MSGFLFLKSRRIKLYIGNFTFVISTAFVVEHAAGFVGGESFLVLVGMVLFQVCFQPLGRLLAV